MKTVIVLVVLVGIPLYLLLRALRPRPGDTPTGDPAEPYLLDEPPYDV